MYRSVCATGGKILLVKPIAVYDGLSVGLELLPDAPCGEFPQTHSGILTRREKHRPALVPFDGGDGTLQNVISIIRACVT